MVFPAGSVREARWDMDNIADVFTAVRCQGWLCVTSADEGAEVSVRADQPVVAASVIKVLIGLVAESAFVEGWLDPTRPITLASRRRTPGPVGFSLFEDDVRVSCRDLVVAMMTISDNVAADALLDMVGIDACNRAAADLGLGDTLIVSEFATAIDSIASEAGFHDWAELTHWSESAPSGAQKEIEALIRRSSPLDPPRATRTTAHDMCRLLRLIWTDKAASAPACARIRAHMAHQLTRNRLASGFGPTARVAAKSGGLLGVVRNEVGVIDLADENRFYAAVFTRSMPDAVDAHVNAAIGTAAALAVQAMTS